MRIIFTAEVKVMTSATTMEKRFTVCLTQELDEWLTEAQWQERKTRSELIREGLDLLKRELEEEAK